MAVKQFSPILKTSQHVLTDLVAVAQDRGTPLESVDFDLLSYKTYFKGTIEEEWQPIVSNNLLDYTTEAEIRSKTFVLRQEYDIRIRPILPPTPLFELNFTIATDQSKSKAIALIDPSSKIPLKKGIQVWIKEAIQRKKIRSGLMIGIFEDRLDQEINRLLHKLQKQGPLTEPYRLPVSDCFAPVWPADDALIPHYKKIQRENNVVDPVQPDDLVLEYVFAQKGRDGRNCLGEFVSVPDPAIRYAGKLQIDEETLRAEEDERSIRFYALKSGFMKRQNGIFGIGNDLALKNATFKSTGSIEAGLDKEISLSIKNNKHSEDAVGSGVNIDVKTLDVTGTIGRSAKIQACEVTIGAQTHKKSEIVVTEHANIHLHRGNLTAKSATIGVLETGTVNAQTVHIDKMVGGEIIAEKVYIKTLYSNAKITALEWIEIDSISGEGNNLIIDPRSIPSYHAKIELLEIKSRKQTAKLQEKGKEYTAKQLSFKDKAARLEHFKQKIKDAKQSGKAPNKADVIRIQQIKKESEDLQLLKEDLQILESELHATNDELESLYEADLHAKIIHKGRYDGLTRIVFIDPKNGEKHSITPQGTVTTLFLRKEGDEKKIIQDSSH